MFRIFKKKKKIFTCNFLTWLLALARLDKSLRKIGTCDLKNGNTYGRNGKLTNSCKACLNSSVDMLPLWMCKQQNKDHFLSKSNQNIKNSE